MRHSIWIAAAVLAADRITKLLARQMTGPVTLIPGVLGLRCCENTGMAFSLFSGNTWMLGILSLVLLAVGAWILHGCRLGPLTRSAAMLILGGALGNAVDRLFLGSVTDMFEVLLFRFAVFNAADSAVVAGCFLLALSLFLRPQEWEKKE